MNYEIPVVLFIFKRKKVIQIIDQIRIIQPKKIYIVADYGRTKEECDLCDECRKMVEKSIDWNCQVVKKYAKSNIGVYQNIGEGAKWVFSIESKAIFLEDDNLPELSFFTFCKDMLEKYENEEKVLWVCGTNYLGNYQSENSYFFTHHMLPCGWASWSHKFLKYYDGLLTNINNAGSKICKKSFVSKKLYIQSYGNWMGEYYLISTGKKPKSWDYQMDFSIKTNGLFGICPAKNQIKNIGVDADSIHGGNKKGFIMNERFCGMDSYHLETPLIHPSKISVDKKFEKKLGKIILYPFSIRIKNELSYIIRKLMHIPYGTRIKDHFHDKK